MTLDLVCHDAARAASFFSISFFFSFLLGFHSLPFTSHMGPGPISE